MPNKHASVKSAHSHSPMVGSAGFLTPKLNEHMPAENLTRLTENRLNAQTHYSDAKSHVAQ